MSDAGRFAKFTGPPTPTGCVPWTGTRRYNGYGRFWLTGKMRDAHRAAYILAIGPIPDGLHVDHLCARRDCVNPDHLRLVTNKQNHENLRGAYRNSKSGVRGVHWVPRLSAWRARVTHHGRKHEVGVFRDLAEAGVAVTNARLALFTHNEQDKDLR